METEKPFSTSIEKESWISQMRKGVLELAILAILNQREMYGFEIIDILKNQHDLEISAGTVYPLLSRLKKAGSITSQWRESLVGPPRKYYCLTDRGIDELSGMTKAWFRISNNLKELLKGGATCGNK